MAGLARARSAAEAFGVRVIAGIEITAVHEGADVHMLSYFFATEDAEGAEFTEFLDAQRADRARRVGEILDRLESMGIVLNRAAILKRASKMAGQAIGRPAVARQLVANGHARDVADAFDRLLGMGKPAFVPRRGVAPAQVIDIVRRAGGIVSFAHPGKLHFDHLIPTLASQGLAAIEVFHPDHDAALVEKYGAMARALGLAMSGGSDYHGPGSGRADAMGRVMLPADAFADLEQRARA